jgi:hypothetical protein
VIDEKIFIWTTMIAAYGWKYSLTPVSDLTGFVMLGA